MSHTWQRLVQELREVVQLDPDLLVVVRRPLELEDECDLAELRRASEAVERLRDA